MFGQRTPAGGSAYLEENCISEMVGAKNTLLSLFTRIVNQNESYVCRTACQRIIASNYHSAKCFYVFLVICSLKEICLQTIQICLIKCVIMRPYIFDNRLLTNNSNMN